MPLSLSPSPSTRAPAATAAVGGTNEATPPRADARPAPEGGDTNGARPTASRRLALGDVGLDAGPGAQMLQRARADADGLKRTVEAERTAATADASGASGEESSEESSEGRSADESGDELMALLASGVEHKLLTEAEADTFTDALARGGTTADAIHEDALEVICSCSRIPARPAAASEEDTLAELRAAERKARATGRGGATVAAGRRSAAGRRPQRARNLVHAAAATAAASAPATDRPRGAPKKWVLPPERAPSTRAPLSPWWWELHSREWLALSRRQRKRLNVIAGQESGQRAMEVARGWGKPTGGGGHRA